MSEAVAKAPLMPLTTQIVSSFLARNSLPLDQLPKLIQGVYQALAHTSAPQPEPEPMEKPQPAVPIRKSVQPDYLICLEDGKKLKMLKRHLKSVYGMTPDDYRAKWGLPSDYPMVAPNYAEDRSRLAKEIGLGRRSKEAAEEAGRRAGPER